VASVFNGASSVIQINNNSAVTGDVGAGDMGGFTLFARGDATNPSNSQCKEVIIYAAAHGDTTRARVISYLMAVGAL
jgi:hypothetical protein